MIEKIIEYRQDETDAEVFSILKQGSGMEKIASYSGELQVFINALKAKADKIYALINALSAYEGFGPNNNSDAFPKSVFEMGYHKSFEENGYVYSHHANKDPKKAMGKVIFSHYNPGMQRVELIVELDKIKAKSIIDRMDAGELPKTSMGCKIKKDFCSVCGNGAKRRIDYCDHLKYHMGKVLPSGKKVYAINPNPKFFDISIVTIPAEKTSGVIAKLENLGLAKVASDNNISAANGGADALEKVANKESTAEIKKKITNVDVVKIDTDPKRLIVDSQERLSKETLKKLANFPISEVLSTFLGLRIMPKREDFQKLAFLSIGKEELADKLEKQGLVFSVDTSTETTKLPDVSIDNFNVKIAEMLVPEILGSSLTKELVIARNLTKIAVETQSGYIFPKIQQPVQDSTLKRFLFSKSEEPKTTAHKNPLVAGSVIGGLYLAYARVFNNFSPTAFRSFLLKHPWLLPLVVGAGTTGSLWAQTKTFNKTASMKTLDKVLLHSLYTVPASYYGAATKEDKARKGLEITSMENFLRKHPFLVGVASSLAATKAHGPIGRASKYIKNLKFQKPIIKKTANFINKLEDEHLNDIYEDLIL